MKFLSRWGVVLFAILAIAGGAWNFLISGNEVERVDKLMVQFNEVDPVRNQKKILLSNLNAKIVSLETTLAATSDLTSNQRFMYSVLLGINASIPSQSLKLTKVNYTGGSEIQIDGISANDANILVFIENLAVIDVIEKASLSTMSVSEVSSQNVKTFVVKITLIQQETIDSREEADGA